MKKLILVLIVIFPCLLMGAINFNGNNGNYLPIPDSITLEPELGAWSFMIWMKFPVATADARQIYVIWQYESSSADLWLTFYPRYDAQGGSYVLGRFESSGREETLASGIGTNYADGVWHHLALTRPASGSGDMKFYIDGAVKTSVATISGNNVNPSAVFNLMAGYDGAQPMIGRFCEIVVIKGTELSIGQIKNAMVRRWIPDSNTKLYYPLNEGAINLGPGGTTAGDLSGTGNHSDDTGSMTYTDGPPILWNQGD